MEKSDIYTAIVRLLEQSTRLDWRHVRNDDRPFRAYGIDSLSLMRWVSAIEQEFGIVIDDIEIFAASSFHRMVDVVHDKMHKPGAP